MKSVNVLGTKYMIKEDTDKNDPRLKECDGYCDTTVKVCVIHDPEFHIMNKRLTGLLFNFLKYFKCFKKQIVYKSYQ